MSGKLLFQLPGINPIDCAWQSRGGNVLAISTGDHVRIWDRSGRVVHDQPIKRAQLAWDADGQILAILALRSYSLSLLYYGDGKRQRTLEFELRDILTTMSWSKSLPILALGTQKGSLILVDFKTDQKLPVLGKHSKKISVCAWSKENLLALGSVDGTISINDSSGDTKYKQMVRSEPQDLQFGTMKSENRSHTSDTISTLLDNKSIFLWKFTTDEQSELSFQSKYGKLISYCWYGDGYIAIAFMSGRVIGVSTHMAEIGTEIFNIQDHSEFCTSMKLTKDLSKLATSGEDSIRIHSSNNLKVVDSIIPIGQGFMIRIFKGVGEDN